MGGCVILIVYIFVKNCSAETCQSDVNLKTAKKVRIYFFLVASNVQNLSHKHFKIIIIISLIIFSAIFSKGKEPQPYSSKVELLSNS